jgi:hypothetical protein|nr:MAG TPA: hypothetical protein [Microviridae sp.]
MPIPALIGASLISGATSSLGSIINGMSQARENARARDFSREMFDKQVAYQNSINQQQMAYQDKVNQENRDWSNETAVRQRIEDAGYNPYLYNGQASASSVGSANSANLGASVSPMSPTANPAPQYGNALISFMDSYNNAYDTLRKQKIDSVVDNSYGGTGNKEKTDSNNATKLLEIQTKVENEVLTSYIIDNATKRLIATDENGQPINDPLTGQPLTYSQAMMKAEYKEKVKGIEKIMKEIENISKNGELIDIDVLLKKYENEYLQPQQLEVLKSTVDELNSRKKLNDANTKQTKILTGVTRDNIVADTKNKNADTANKNANTAKTNEETKNVPKQGLNIDADTANKRLQGVLMRSQNAKTMAERQKVFAEIKKISAEIPGIVADGELKKWKAKLEKFNYDMRIWREFLNSMDKISGIQNKFADTNSKNLNTFMKVATGMSGR